VLFKKKENFSGLFREDSAFAKKTLWIFQKNTSEGFHIFLKGGILHVRPVG
jgi:hypothetical protein